MREIKFRAWERKLNKMIYQDDFPIIEWYKGIPKYLHLEGTRFSDNFILMQYTGLKDKNGKGIYEGDVVTGVWTLSGIHSSNLYNVVEWDSEYAGFFPFCEQDGFDNGNFEDVEIIGNLYENPELLKEEK